MSKKSESPKEVHQPDDVFFKKLMSESEHVVGYMRALAPEFAKMVDLSTLKLSNESFITDDLKTFSADVVWRCRLKESEEEVYVTFLCENKSEPETYISIQVGLYLMLAYYQISKEKGRKLEPIIPLVFYNGDRDWKPKTIDDLFRKHPIFEQIQPFLPSFRFHFTNVNTMPREELLAIERSFLRSALLALANKHDVFWLQENISVIFDFEERKEHLLLSLGRYFYGVIERLPDELRKDAVNLKNEVNMKVNSTLDLILREGKEIGKEIGRKIGKEIGIEEGKEIGKEIGAINGEKIANLLRDIDTILYFTVDMPDFPIENILSLISRSKEFILATQKEFKGGNERKARKYMAKLLKEYEPLNDHQLKSVEKLFDKFLPKLRKK